jgi:hypothetical protein
LWGLKLGPRVGGCLEIVNRKGNLPEFDVRGIDVGKARWSLLLNQVFENADNFGLCNFDRKHLILGITDNEAVE